MSKTVLSDQGQLDPEEKMSVDQIRELQTERTAKILKYA